MTIKRYDATADTTITDAFYENLITRATASNMGASDSIEIFSLYGQTTSNSLEKARALLKFPIDKIYSDRIAGNIPSSGSIKFFLKLSNAEHPYTLPKDFYLSVHPLSQSWDEGYGLDMEGYSDPGQGLSNGYGANWMYASSGTLWSPSGSSFLTSSNYDLKYHFVKGYEDLEIDITNLTEEWISNNIPNNGIVVKLSGSFEDGTKKTSFFTKKFFARGTQFFYKKPIIEARWEEVIKDDRQSFYASSSLLNNIDNTYNLYFYNRFNGKLKNINLNPNLLIKLYSDSNYVNEVASSSSVTNPLPGIYKASISAQTTASILYDKWYLSGSESTVFYKNFFDVYQYEPQEYFSNDEYIYSITNLKPRYSTQENVIFRIFSRVKNWNPNIYSVASDSIENSCIKNLFYKIFRIDDGYEVIGYSTGSLEYTKTSYDIKGNYFNFDMSLLEPDGAYAIQLARWDGNTLEEFKQIFKFRVE